MSRYSLKFGRHKYGALNLLLAKWLRLYARAEPYCYVTLGGTELRDISNLDWIHRDLTSKIYSFEQDPRRYKIAIQTAAKLRINGLTLSVLADDLFNYERTDDQPHIFYLDLFRNCNRANYQAEFSEWFDNGVIRPNDFLIMTSYLGRKVSWQKTLEPFESEFILLSATEVEQKKSLYNVYHPAMVMNRALRHAGLHNEIRLKTLCCIKYFDTSTMGLYGIRCEEGRTVLSELIDGCFKADLTKGAQVVFETPPNPYRIK